MPDNSILAVRYWRDALDFRHHRHRSVARGQWVCECTLFSILNSFWKVSSFSTLWRFHLLVANISVNDIGAIHRMAFKRFTKRLSNAIGRRFVINERPIDRLMLAIRSGKLMLIAIQRKKNGLHENRLMVELFLQERQGDACSRWPKNSTLWRRWSELKIIEYWFM